MIKAGGFKCFINSIHNSLLKDACIFTWNIWPSGFCQFTMRICILLLLNARVLPMIVNIYNVLTIGTLLCSRANSALY